MPEPTIWVCEKGHVDDHHLTAPNDGDKCSRCGGTCTPFASVELLAREYVERLRVNVGLLAENTQLKKKLEGGGGATAPSEPRRDRTARTDVAGRGAGESGSPPLTFAELRDQHVTRYSLAEFTDLLTGDEAVEAALAKLPYAKRPEVRRALQAAIASIKGEGR